MTKKISFEEFYNQTLNKAAKDLTQERAARQKEARHRVAKLTGEDRIGKMLDVHNYKSTRKSNEPTQKQTSKAVTKPTKGLHTHAILTKSKNIPLGYEVV